MRISRKIILLAIFAALLSGCEGEKSQIVVLYKNSVATGNSVVSFINYSDPHGEIASMYCEDLRKVYSARYQITYVCSTEVFEEYRPEIK